MRTLYVVAAVVGLLGVGVHEAAAQPAGLVYSGPLHQVIGGFPGPSSTNVFIDGGDPEFFVDVVAGVPNANAGGMTVIRTPFNSAVAGNAAGHFKSFAYGEIFDQITAEFALPSIHVPMTEPGYLASGYDFGGVAPGGPLGWLFNESEAKDYYWAFAMVPDGALGMVSGWMRVTVNPIIVNQANQQLSGGEIILREWAISTTGPEPLAVGVVPEPGAFGMIGAAAFSIIRRRRR